MRPAGCLCGTRGDVPAGDAWLGPREREAQATLVMPRRRATWRLGRWTVKAALAAWLGTTPDEVEILAAPDGAPEAWAGDARLDAEVSLSHRAGLALAFVGDVDAALGCDVEVVEPRSGAFMREWLTPAEQAFVAGSRSGDEAALRANLAWTGKEASAKVRRGGLRLNLRAAEITPGPGSRGAWRPLTIAWPDAGADHGWWRAERGYVMTVAAGAPIAPPAPLAVPAGLSRPRAGAPSPVR